MPKVAVLVPCYKRDEYTEKCIKSIAEAQSYENVYFFLVNDGSGHNTDNIFNSVELPNKKVISYTHNVGLRRVITDFLETYSDFEYLVKVDNDCLVPKNWLNDILLPLTNNWYDIVSPNVMPSDAANKIGKAPDEHGIRPSSHVGGLWAMRSEMLDDVQFEKIDCDGIIGAFPLLKQIIIEKEPRIGWLPNVVFQDMGHWSGQHPEHIKSEEHFKYSLEIGRRVAWA